MNYTDVVNELVQLAATEITDSAFVQLLPRIFDYAEQRIYRELDLLSTVTTYSGSQLTAGNRTFDLPASNPFFVVLQQVNVITPATATNPELGTRNPLEPVTKEYLDFVWNSSAGAAVPANFAMIDETTIILGPWPDATYTVELVGTVRPAPLSPTNTSTFLTVHLPDLFTAACMIFVAGKQRDFGSQADDPKMAQSWENQYQLLFASANAEEMRKRWRKPAVT